MVSEGRSRLYEEKQRGTTERAMHTPTMAYNLVERLVGLDLPCVARQGRSRLYQEKRRGTTERAMHTLTMGVLLIGKAHGPGFAIRGQRGPHKIVTGEPAWHHREGQCIPLPSADCLMEAPGLHTQYCSSLWPCPLAPVNQIAYYNAQYSMIY